MCLTDRSLSIGPTMDPATFMGGDDPIGVTRNGL